MNSDIINVKLKIFGFYSLDKQEEESENQLKSKEDKTIKKKKNK